MKKLVFILICIAFSHFTFAQNTYSINNEVLELKTEVEGTLDLLWNTFDGKYRYFIKSSDDSIIELKNTKNSDNKFQNEYQTTLNKLTNSDASKVKLTTYSLKQFINRYNAEKDSSYVTKDFKSKLKLRLGIFSGLTNNPFVKNPSNSSVLFFGSEAEVISDDISSRHAGFLNVKYGTESDEFKYSSLQLALGYRYRFVNKDRFNIYGQTKFASLTLSNSTITSTQGNQDISNTAFDTPLIFGLGADIKLGKGYLSLVYDSLFAIFVENEGNFPLDLAIGYKFNL